MKRFWIVLCLLLLAGCSKVPPADPVPEQPAAASDEVYLFTTQDRAVAVNSLGEAVLEVTDGQMSVLYRDDAAVGISVQRSEGVVTDEYGWTHPEKTWCDVYTPQGSFRYSVPLTYVNLFDGLLLGYNEPAGKTQLYRFSDGQLLYDDVYAHYVLGGYHYVNQDYWEAPGVFLDGNGTVVYTLPQELTHGGSVANRYLTVMHNGLCGLIAPDGQMILECAYEEIHGDDRCIYAKQDGQWLAIRDGEVVFTWPTKILMWTAPSVIVAADAEESLYCLIAPDGTPLMQKPFRWPSFHDWDADGTADVIEASDENYETTLLFRPDGTVLWHMTEDGYLTVLDEKAVLLCRWLDGGSKWSLLDLTLGSETPIAQGSDTYCSPLYGRFGIEPKYLTVGRTNNQGWYRTDLLTPDGTSIARDLQDVYYRENGIFQCRRGFTSGLLRTDGTWLYEESSFSDLNDS